MPSSFKHPRCPVSIARIARLAVSNDHKNKCYGSAILFDALQKIFNISKIIGIYAVIVDAKNAEAKTFYEYYGFTSCMGYDMTLILPMKTIAKLF